MDEILIKKKDHKLLIGEDPVLVLDLEGQNHFIESGGKRIPYRKQIHISPDLLCGKRKKVLQTAAGYYYGQACRVAEGVEAAKRYREKANISVREIRR